ncbi:unnamed protein product, partial [marine sediment metagenome]
DMQVYEKSRKIIRECPGKDIFIAFADLDMYGHLLFGSDEYIEKIDTLFEQVSHLAGLYTDINSNGKVILVSDHGMAKITGSVKFDLPSSAGQPSEHSYLHFLDETMARVWVFDEMLKDDIRCYLQSLPGGTLLTNKERAHYGITSQNFGTFIFLLEEGHVFSPHFFGKGRHGGGAHGYQPDLPSQKAVLCSNLEFSKESFNIADVFGILDGVYGGI